MAENTTSRSSSKASAARAKPAREAASSVRSSAGSAATGDRASKRELAAARLQSKAERQHRRANEERILEIVDILNRENPEYGRLRKIWLALILTGLVAVIATLAFGQFSANSSGSTKELYNTLTTVALIVGYLFVIGAFVFDFIKIRPIRKASDERARSMSDKKRAEIVMDYEERRREKRLAKQAAKK